MPLIQGLFQWDAIPEVQPDPVDSMMDVLEAGGGSTPFVLDELGRSPAKLTTTIPSASGITTWEDQMVAPLAVGNWESYMNVDPQDLPTPEETSVKSTVEEGYLS